MIDPFIFRHVLVTIRTLHVAIQLRQAMSDFDISNIQDPNQVEITDLDAQSGGFGDAVSIRLLRFVRSLPYVKESRGRFILLMYCMCLMVLLFMIQPGLPTITEHFVGPQAHDLQYPLAVYYPFTIQDTASEQNVTWIRTSDGHIITLQIAPGRFVGRHCRVRHWFAPPKYAHPMIMTCT